MIPTPIVATERVSLVHGDCLASLQMLAPCSIDSVVTDPPYELGFMNKGWDTAGISFSVDLWREALRALKPGGHILAFGGTRTYHRMTCAIEDAGFEIRDSLHWMYGTGFCKSRDYLRYEIRPALEEQLRAQGVEGAITWR